MRQLTSLDGLRHVPRGMALPQRPGARFGGPKGVIKARKWDVWWRKALSLG